MKRSIILIAFSLFRSVTFGQIFTVAFQSDRGNIIYTTIPNNFTLLSNVSSSDIECKIDQNGIIKYQGSGSINVLVPEPGNYNITITQKSTGISYTYPYRAKSLPIPKASILAALSDSILSSQLAEFTELSLVYDPFDYNISAKVLSFSVLKISSENTRNELQNTGGMFSNEIKSLLTKSSSGDILIFKNIKAKGVDPRELKIPDLLIYVK